MSRMSLRLLREESPDLGGAVEVPIGPAEETRVVWRRALFGTVGSTGSQRSGGGQGGGDRPHRRGGRASSCCAAKERVYSLSCVTTIPSTTWSSTAFARSSSRGEASAVFRSAQASRRSCRSDASQQIQRRARCPHRPRRHQER